MCFTLCSSCHFISLFILLGLAVRNCKASGWTPPTLLGCISVEGRELLYLAQELEQGQQVLTESALGHVTEDLKTFISSSRGQNISGGDVQVGGRVIRSLLAQLQEGVALNGSGFTGSGLPGLVEGADLLLAAELKEEWLTEVRPASFSASDFLATLEELSKATSLVGVADDYTGSNIRIKKETPEPQAMASSAPVSLELQDMTVSASTSPRASNGPLLSEVIYTLLPTVSSFLPFAADFNASDLAVATPILSVQAVDQLGSEITDVMVNMTLGFTMLPENQETAGQVKCVSWNYQGRCV